MCGDLEEEDTEAERLYAAFLHAAHSALHDMVDHRGGSRNRLDNQESPVPDAAVHGYMDGLFGDILNACIKDGRRVAESDRYRVLASQAIVLARVAGFLAGQLDLREDPLRTSVAALMAGYDARYAEHDHDGGHHH
ncbi:hypothetical protein [Nevskia soli]|uniref:hypothetical protein n=1 Tax=Nevskia soli TaxID=418856 RepID=UPI00068A4D14|nr:hypothetical protein [Nevskia soli]